MRLLDNSTLAALPACVRRPHYDRPRLEIGLAHIGVGAFHRCHQGEYTDEMLEARFGAWGVVGINLRPPQLAASLGPQDNLYSRTLREGMQAQTRIIGCICQTIDVACGETAGQAIAQLATPAVSTVTLTLTEKGYCHVPATGRLDWSNADLLADLRAPAVPRTALGLLACALERRRANGLPGLALISCDNIPANGTILRNAMIDFAAAGQGPLAGWIESNCTFPGTMVDRIVPATSIEDIDAVSGILGVRDNAAVTGEPFRQWVIEDHFSGERPPWDLAGAEFVVDARRHELIKMRILNAAQSTFSHFGALLGHEFSFQAAADPLLDELVRRMLEQETAPTLQDWTAPEIARYIDTSRSRIANSAIRHRCHQIGTDGSQKIVQRILRPLQEQLAMGAAAPLLTFAVAGWIAYVLRGSHRFGHLWAAVDPWAGEMIRLADDERLDFPALAEAVLSIEAVFGGGFPVDAIVAPVASHLEALLSGDARTHIAAVLERCPQ